MASKTLATILIVIVAIFCLPVVFGILVGIFGGLFGAVMGIFGGIVGAIGGVIGGIFGAIGSVIEGIFHWGFWPFTWNFCTFALVVFMIVLMTRSRQNRR